MHSRFTSICLWRILQQKENRLCLEKHYIQQQLLQHWQQQR